MCLLVTAIDCHPDVPFVFAGNRDEFHARPTARAYWWRTLGPDDPDLYGGRDLEAGGTWLALDRRARFATVTNFRQGGESQSAAVSRGQLVTSFVAGDAPATRFADELLTRLSDYAGFNLLFGELRGEKNVPSLFACSNRGESIQPLNRGIHTLSNRHLNTPWPKAERLRDTLAGMLQPGPSIDALFDMLGDRQRAPDSALPDTGIPLDWERMLSAPFIVSDDYGTRASTVMLMTRSGDITMVERSFDAGGDCSRESRLTLRADSLDG